MFNKTVAAALLTAALFTGCVSKEKEGAVQAAPDFTLKDLAGREVRLSDQKGRVVLVEFWATWCPPCRTSIPALEKLHAAYAGKGLTILAVSMDEGGVDKIRAFAAEYKITYTVLQGTTPVADKYSVRMIPATYLVDRQGIIQKHYLGGMSEDRIEEDIRSLL